jgi:hypothetical protein
MLLLLIQVKLACKLMARDLGPYTSYIIERRIESSSASYLIQEDTGTRHIWVIFFRKAARDFP